MYKFTTFMAMLMMALGGAFMGMVTIASVLWSDGLLCAGTFEKIFIFSVGVVFCYCGSILIKEVINYLLSNEEDR